MIAAFDLRDRRIIVTGTASGIGAAALEALVGAGARVVGMDVSDAAGLVIAQSATARGPGSATYAHCDVSDAPGVRAAFDAAATYLGGLDVMINIAGVERKAAAEDIAQADWDLMMDVNARGTMNTNQAAFAHMRAAGGRIINFSSSAGVIGLPGCAHYAAAKAAVLGWTRTAAREWGRHGITVNAMAPAMWTPMYEKFRARLDAAQLAAHDATMEAIVPFGGRLGDPRRDMAPVLLFLASDAARFITGQTLAVDGGLLIP